MVLYRQIRGASTAHALRTVLLTGVPRSYETVPPRILEWDYASDLVVLLGGGRFLRSEVPLYCTPCPLGQDLRVTADERGGNQLKRFCSLLPERWVKPGPELA